MAYIDASEAQKTKDERTLFLAALLIGRARAETANFQDKSRSGRVARPPAAVSASSVMDCIKAHESGNYAEQSHPGSGSGAYQVIPSTWNVWSARAGYPGYAYAYLAPPNVQDAVVQYMLANGGAANWSVRYGPDPCTGH